MKQKRVRLKYKNQKFNLNLEICSGFCRFKGLMFSRRQNAKALLFEQKKMTKQAIHSLFVFFPFVAVWLDDKNKIINYEVVRPFKFYIVPEEKYKRLIEIPLNKKYFRVIELFSDK